MREVDYTPSYRAWMAALLTSVGSIAEIRRIITKTNGIGDPDYHSLRKLANSSTIAHWFGNRASLPAQEPKIVLSRLLDLMEMAVPVRPQGAIEGLAFSEVIDRLRLQRIANFTNRTDDAKINSQLYDLGFVAFPVESVDAFDIDRLGLESGLTDGELPKYCPRDQDAVLRTFLDSTSQNSLLVSGPYKSGKTRTLIESLKGSALLGWQVYWITPARQTEEVFLKLLDGIKSNTNIFILDDLQRFGFGKNIGKDQHFVKCLTAKGKILSTIGAKDLASWQVSRVDHSLEETLPTSSFVSGDFIGNLNEVHIRLEAELSDEELELADKYFGDRFLKNDLRRLASFFSSKEAIQARVSAMLNGEDEFTRAFVKAMVDQRILSPWGETKLNFRHFVEHQINLTNVLWDDKKFEETLDYALRPISPGGPHAVLVKNLEDRKLLQLSDAAWEAIKPNSWSPNGLEKLFSDPPEAAWQIASAGYVNQAVNYLQSLSNAQDDKGFYVLGLCLKELKMIPEAIASFEKAALKNNLDAVNEVAILFFESGDLIQSEKWFERLIESKDPSWILNLGRFYFRTGRTGKALTTLDHYWLLGGDDEEALNLLGQCKYKSGLPSEGRKIFEDLVNRGHTECLIDIGNGYELEGNFDMAHETFLKAILAGDEGARINLGNMFYRQGKFSEAERAWLECLKYAKDPETKGTVENKIGCIYLDLKDYEIAGTYFEKALKHGDAFAAANLAEIAKFFGHTDEALLRYEESIALGLNDGYLLLGNFLSKLGRAEEAKVTYLKGATRLHADCTAALGNFEANAANYQAAIYLYLKSVDLGCKWVYYNLSRCYSSVGDHESFKYWASRGVESGNEDCVELLKRDEFPLDI